MATNFKLFMHETRDSLHLKICGDFDGNSAHELINAIKDNAAKSYQIFIDTEDLKNIYPFGRDVFHNNLAVSKMQSNKIVFIGKNQNNFNL
jgi:hypothetical protein